MSKPNSGGPAFPYPTTYFERSDGAIMTEYGVPGMSLRQYYAGQALVGILANDNLVQTCLAMAVEYQMTAERVFAQRAVKISDAIITELEKETT